MQIWFQVFVLAVTRCETIVRERVRGEEIIDRAVPACHEPATARSLFRMLEEKM